MWFVNEVFSIWEYVKFVMCFIVDFYLEIVFVYVCVIVSVRNMVEVYVFLCEYM